MNSKTPIFFVSVMYILFMSGCATQSQSTTKDCLNSDVAAVAFEIEMCKLINDAENGYQIAQVKLGQIYRNGDYIDQDYAKSLYWYTKAAESGNSRAQNNVGAMYFHGHGVEINHQLAVKWYTLASTQGNMFSQTNLAAMYEKGLGVEPNIETAILLYKKASKQGKQSAKNGLAWIFATFPDEHIRNGERALYWAKLAAESSDYADSHILDTLAAAYAENGIFQEALKIQGQAISKTSEEFMEDYKSRYLLYKVGKKYRTQILQRK